MPAVGAQGGRVEALSRRERGAVQDCYFDTAGGIQRGAHWRLGGGKEGGERKLMYKGLARKTIICRGVVHEIGILYFNTHASRASRLIFLAK